MKPDRWVQNVHRRLRARGHDPDEVVYNTSKSGQTVIMQFASKAVAAEAAVLASEQKVEAKSLGFSTVEFTLPTEKRSGRRVSALSTPTGGEVTDLPSGEFL